MKFLLDEDLNPDVAEIGRGFVLDVISVHEIDRLGLDDRRQLKLASRDERIFLTRNRDDFIKLTVEFFRAGAQHSGVLIVPYSLPNHQPKRIARALRSWYERQRQHGEPGPYIIDFLADPPAGSQRE